MQLTEQHVTEMLHPDLADADPTQTYLESFSQKYTQLYPQGE
jgi:hypothetical protein